MSENELTAILERYETRHDEFAELVRDLVLTIRAARADAILWSDNYQAAKDRLQQIVVLAGGVIK